MTSLVISQPMVFPWVGLFEQIRLSDTFVHLDDVQLPGGGSFSTRVQVKTSQGLRWLTVPVVRQRGALIRDTRIDESQRWRDRHLHTLRQAYSKAPFFDQMFDVVDRVYRIKSNFLWEFNVSGIEEACAFFGFDPQFIVSSSLGTTTHGTQKVLDLARKLGAQRYVSGLGGLNYLEHDVFEAAGIRVEYMAYEKAPYPQLHGLFTSSVTILDCMANCGPEGADYIRSESVYWRELVGGKAQAPAAGNEAEV